MLIHPYQYNEIGSILGNFLVFSLDYTSNSIILFICSYLNFEIFNVNFQYHWLGFVRVSLCVQCFFFVKFFVTVITLNLFLPVSCLHVVLKVLFCTRFKVAFITFLLVNCFNMISQIILWRGSEITLVTFISFSYLSFFLMNIHCVFLQQCYWSWSELTLPFHFGT